MSDLKRKVGFREWLAKAKRTTIPAHVIDPCELLDHPELDPKGALKVYGEAVVPPIPAETKAERNLIRRNSTIERRRWKKESGSNLPTKSLRRLALQLGKNPRTVRRYCESGLIPKRFARRTKGGHWRVSSSEKALRAIRRAISGFARDRRKSARKEVEEIIKRTHIARRLALTADHKLPEDEKPAEPFFVVRNGVQIRNPSHYLTPPSEAVKSAAVSAPRQAELRVAVRYLYSLQQTPTPAALAEQLGISRATLYRRYTGDQIKRAIHDAPNSGGEKAVRAAENLSVTRKNTASTTMIWRSCVLIRNCLAESDELPSSVNPPRVAT